MDFEEYLQKRLYHGLTIASLVGTILILALLARDFSHPNASSTLLGIDAAVLLVFAGIGLMSQKRLLPSSWAHPLIAFLLLCMMLKSIATQLITGDTNFVSQPLLLLSISSAVFLSVNWYAGTASALSFIWIPALATFFPWESVALVLLALAVLVILGSLFVRWHRAQIRDRFELEREVKVLRGLVPICASCKKIRDEAGEWNEMERYIQSRSEAEFSHGYCPECNARFREEISRGTVSP